MSSLVGGAHTLGTRVSEKVSTELNTVLPSAVDFYLNTNSQQTIYRQAVDSQATLRPPEHKPMSTETSYPRH